MILHNFKHNGTDKHRRGSLQGFPCREDVHNVYGSFTGEQKRFRLQHYLLEINAGSVCSTLVCFLNKTNFLYVNWCA